MIENIAIYLYLYCVHFDGDDNVAFSRTFYT